MNRAAEGFAGLRPQALSKASIRAAEPLTVMMSRCRIPPGIDPFQSTSAMILFENAVGNHLSVDSVGGRGGVLFVNGNRTTCRAFHELGMKDSVCIAEI